MFTAKAAAGEAQSALAVDEPWCPARGSAELGLERSVARANCKPDEAGPRGRVLSSPIDGDNSPIHVRPDSQAGPCLNSAPGRSVQRDGARRANSPRAARRPLSKRTHQPFTIQRFGQRLGARMG